MQNCNMYVYIYTSYIHLTTAWYFLNVENPVVWGPNLNASFQVYPGFSEDMFTKFYYN